MKVHVSLSDLSKYAINNINIYFGKDPLFLEGKGDLIFEKDNEFKHVVRNVDNKTAYKRLRSFFYPSINNFYIVFFRF